MRALRSALLCLGFVLVGGCGTSEGPEPSGPSATAACCKHCGATSKPCGDTCISKDKTCHVGPGCAC